MADTHSHLTSRGSLSWAILDSFQRYVTVIARGTVEAIGVTRDDQGRYVFPLRAARVEDGQLHLSFGGSVRFTAHNGFLDVLIAAPEVLIGPAGGVLGTHTNDEATPLIPLVEIDPVSTPALNASTGGAWNDLPTHLVMAAESHFGDVYPAGTPMAPITVVVEPISS